MIIFEGLNVSGRKDLSYQDFLFAVPVIANRRTVVHFVKIDTNDKNRFGSVVRVLAEEKVPLPFDINQIIGEWNRGNKEESGFNECKCKGREGRTSVRQKMEESKARVIEFFTQSMSIGLNDKITL